MTDSQLQHSLLPPAGKTVMARLMSWVDGVEVLGRLELTMSMSNGLLNLWERKRRMENGKKMVAKTLDLGDVSIKSREM